jgi:predicted secreted protein
MHWASGILVFVVLWWLVIFAVLPWGVRIPDKAEPGHADSAPVKPMLGRKVLATTAITAVLWLIVYLVVQSDWLSFREMARHM